MIIESRTERKLVNDFCNFLHAELNPAPYIEIDRDSPQRVFKSGYDFLIARNGNTMFIEAKKLKSNRNLENKLTDFQKLTKTEIVATSNTYALLAFHAIYRDNLCILVFQKTGPRFFEGYKNIIEMLNYFFKTGKLPK